MTRGNVYNLNEQDAEATPAITQGMFFISNSVACALIDSGITHSFILYNLVKCLSMIPVSLGKTLVVETPTKDILVSYVVCKSYRVKVTNEELTMDLLLLDF